MERKPWSQVHYQLVINRLWESYIYTDKPITWAAQKVHGITKEDLADAPKLMLLWPEIKKRLGNSAVVAHGHGTEKRFLRAFPGHGFGPWIDTLHLSRAVFPELKKHSLSHICETQGLTSKVDTLVPDKTWQLNKAVFAISSIANSAKRITLRSPKNKNFTSILSS